MKTFSIISALLLGVGITGALAQDASGTRPARPRAGGDQTSKPDLEAMFKRFDVNGDEKISREEAPERLAQNFDQFDMNKDGAVTLREFRGRQAGVGAGEQGTRSAPGEIFKQFDLDGDGKVSRDEMTSAFDRLDADKDGAITVRELARQQADRRSAASPRSASEDDMFKRFDANGDGKISKEEAPERLARNFDRMDIDKDGLVSPREFNAARNSVPGNPERPQRRGGNRASQ